MEAIFQNPLIARLLKTRDYIFPVVVLSSVIMLVIPFPPFMIDLFIALSLAAAFVTVILALSINDPLEFSVFPTWILVATVFFLGLNVATTRSILSIGYAGNIVNTFGNVVTAGNYVVGAVIFVILIAVNFIVIANGTQRIGEVAARFTLDAMPGKQMSIDADLTNGLINEDEARARRKKLEQEADYYGAMDGASRFIKGYAIVGIVITIVNIGAGFIIGMVQKGLTATESAQLYTTLTIGDGLQSQLPALLLSVATGIMVKATPSKVTPEEVLSTMGVDPMQIEIGFSLVPLVDTNTEGDLLDRITVIRKQIATELGIVIPPIRIRDNIQLKPSEYVVKIRGNIVA
ncbi:MAG: flagellar biosynthesis protein FlhA, partial [bacterium]|nr:flagellar biosynthesis protein FlhA [bacterium]